MLLFYLRFHIKRAATEDWTQHELRVLEWYANIVEYLRTEVLRSQNDLDKDLEILQNAEISWGLRMALVYRTERIKILLNQARVVSLMKYVVSYAK
jgi:hypothetical protein